MRLQARATRVPMRLVPLVVWSVLLTGRPCICQQLLLLLLPFSLPLLPLVLYEWCAALPAGASAVVAAAVAGVAGVDPSRIYTSSVGPFGYACAPLYASEHATRSVLWARNPRGVNRS
jgi:hypothetical protein